MSVHDEGDEPRGLITRETALFLDFDGTLSPIRDDPEAVFLPEGGDLTLVALAKALDGAVALVSGRDGRDLSKRVPHGLWRVGNHGGMLLKPGQSEPEHVAEIPADLLAAAEDVAAAHEGVVLEIKANVIAVHTRAVPEAEPAVLEALGDIVGPRDDFKLQHGKRVIEIKPSGMDKGVILDTLCTQPPFAGRKPVFVGDDTTDEDAFAAIARLGGFGVKVGDGATSARYRLADVDAVWAWLREGLDAIT